MRLLPGLALILLLAGCASSQVAEQNAKVAEINTQLGLAYLKQNRYELAEVKLEKALQSDPHSSKVNWAMALLKDQTGSYKEADRYYRRAISLDENDAEAHNNYGAFLCKHARYDEGVKTFQDAINNPRYLDKPIAYTNAGICLVRAGDAIKAEGYFRDALDIDERYSPALYQMALLMLDQKRYLAARAYRQRLESSLNREDPKLLLLCAKSERGLGNYSLADKCEAQLKSKFPASEEAASLYHR